MNEREREYNMSVHKVKQKGYLIQFCSQNIRKTHIERGEREKRRKKLREIEESERKNERER